MDINSFVIGYKKGKASGLGLNIAYGDTAPEDTSKIWVKSKKPDKVRVEELTYSKVIDYPFSVSKHYAKGRTAIGSKIYLFGGRDTTTLRKATSYDTITGETVSIGDVAADSNPMHVCGDGEKAYILNYTDLQIYYPATNSYEKSIIANYGSLTNYGNGVDTAVYADGCIYLLGGGNATAQTIYKVDIANKEATKCAGKLLVGLYDPSCVSIGTKIYIFGGYNSQDKSVTNAYCYDTENDSVSAIKFLPEASCGHGCVAYDDKILILGGYNYTKNTATTTYYNKVMVYDPAKDDYETLGGTLLTARKATTAVTVGDKVYMIGSIDADDGKDKIEVYSVMPNVENNTLVMLYKSGGTKIPIINAETVHVDTNIGGAYMGDENNVGQKVEALMYTDGEWTNI